MDEKPIIKLGGQTFTKNRAGTWVDRASKTPVEESFSKILDKAFEASGGTATQPSLTGSRHEDIADSVDDLKYALEDLTDTVLKEKERLTKEFASPVKQIPQPNLVNKIVEDSRPEKDTTSSNAQVTKQEATPDTRKLDSILKKFDSVLDKLSRMATGKPAAQTRNRQNKLQEQMVIGGHSLDTLQAFTIPVPKQPEPQYDPGTFVHKDYATDVKGNLKPGFEKVKTKEGTRYQAETTPKELTTFQAIKQQGKEGMFGTRDPETGDLDTNGFARDAARAAFGPVGRFLMDASERKTRSKYAKRAAENELRKPKDPEAEAETTADKAEKEAETTNGIKPAANDGVFITGVADTVISQLATAITDAINKKPDSDTEQSPEPNGNDGGFAPRRRNIFQRMIDRFRGGGKNRGAKPVAEAAPKKAGFLQKMFGGKTAQAAEAVAEGAPKKAGFLQKMFGGAAKLAPEAGGAVKAGGTLLRVGKGLAGGVGSLVGGLALDYGGDKLIQSGHKKTGAAAKIGASAITGAGIGATLGSVVPILGNGIGAGIGGAIGAGVGFMKNKDMLFEKAPVTPQTAALSNTSKQNVMAKDAAANKSHAMINSVSAPTSVVNNSTQSSIHMPTIGPRGSLDLATFR